MRISDRFLKIGIFNFFIIIYKMINYTVSYNSPLPKPYTFQIIQYLDAIFIYKHYAYHTGTFPDNICRAVVEVQYSSCLLSLEVYRTLVQHTLFHLSYSSNVHTACRRCESELHLHNLRHYSDIQDWETWWSWWLKLGRLRIQL